MARSNEKKPELHLTKYLLGLKSAKQIKAEIDAAYRPARPPTPPHQPTPAESSMSKRTPIGSNEETRVADPKDSAQSAQSVDATPSNEGATNEAPSGFTADQDATILKLKAENKTWKEIGAAVGKSKSSVTTRYKELNSGASSAAQNDEKKEEKKDEQNSGSAPYIKNGQTVTLKADEQFSADELTALTRLVIEDQEQIWERVVAKFYDQSDRHIQPADLKKRLGFGA